jgi:hypothetical protein
MTRNMELTVTQKLRLFLARSGQPVAPWSSVEEVMDRLYGLLYDRREQAGLWEDLAALLDSIQAETRGLLASPDAEILSRTRVATLTAELGRAVRASAEVPRAGAMRRFALGKNASVAACIALLAASFSMGCGSSNSNADKTPDTAIPLADASQPRDTAQPQDTAPSVTKDTATSQDTVPKPTLDTAPGRMPDAEAKADSASRDVALADANDASTAPADAIGDAESTQDSLMDLFRDGSPADIAAKLEASVDLPADQKLDKQVPIPLYKGVSFPSGSA